MVEIETFRKWALALPGSEEHPHFENQSFRVKKKIFATLNAKENRACIKLSDIDQSVFCGFRDDVIYPVPNKWGKQGWTLISLANVEPEMCEDALTTAYETVIAGKKP